MSTFTKEIESIITISEKDVNDLVYKMNTGDINARNKLVEHNLAIIKAVALKYANMYQLSLEDYISIGTIGLILAINKYDPNVSVNIKTFAYSCANNYIKCYLKYISAEKRNYNNDVSLHAYDKYYDNPVAGTLEEVLPYDGPSVEELTESKMRLIELRKMIDRLPNEHRETMYMIYGKNNYSVKEIAAITGMSSQAISFRRCSAIKKLKKFKEIKHIL